MSFDYYDVFILLVSIALLLIFSLKDRKITKLEGAVFVLIFIVYYSYVILIG